MELERIGNLLLQYAEENKESLNQLDGIQGDGDLGITILLGAKALAESAKQSNSISEWFLNGGKALRKAAPSTMGVLISSALIKAGKQINHEPLTLQDWVEIQKAMIEEIQTRGGAKLGDKTILDCFIPAVLAFEEAVASGKDISEVLAYTTKIAHDAATKTETMRSKIGRSSWLGERAKNTIDGGAWVCYQIYDLLCKQLKIKNLK